MSDFLSFHLPDDFVKSYSKRKPQWGFDIGAGNSLGELTFVTKYSRRKADGSKERWHEACRRVTEGFYSILKDHCKTNQTPWNENKAQKAAQDAYDRMFTFKWTPPGRGIWMMGTEFVNGKRNSAALQYRYGIAPWILNIRKRRQKKGFKDANTFLQRICECRSH